MFDELVKQVQRLFSSKKNGAKQVAKLTDQLHYQKLVLIAMSIVLLLGYAKLREDFVCQGSHGVSQRLTTRFCLVNGTRTIVQPELEYKTGTSLLLKVDNNKNNNNKNKNNSNNNNNNNNNNNSNNAGVLAHIGMGFAGQNTQVINHNYMRSQWALLILLAMCSYFAQRNWASLFKSDVLQALLQLEGSSESRIVRAAESAKPYEMLSNLSSNLKEELEARMGIAHAFNTSSSSNSDSNNNNNNNSIPPIRLLSRNERVSKTIDLVDNYVNIYDHKLDYYPNQLTYLLLTKNTPSYKLSCLKLRKALIINSLVSTFYTFSQFVLPLVFISKEYLLFGFAYLVAILIYLKKFITSSETLDINSIDYELSSRIFPISTQCEYKQNGPGGAMENFTVQCTVAINELCSKLFLTIWWYVVISLLVELYTLVTLVLCSITRTTVSWSFGWRFWPQARKQAHLIATFRFKRARLLEQARIARQIFDNNNSHSPSDNNNDDDEVKLDQIGRRKEQEDERVQGVADKTGHKRDLKQRLDSPAQLVYPHSLNRPTKNNSNSRRKPAFFHKRSRLQETQNKRDIYYVESNQCVRMENKRLEADQDADERRNLREKVWYHYCARDVCLGLVGLARRIVCCRAQQRRKRIEEEAEKDINIYYLLYLLYLRVGKSQSRIEEIIRMTARALENYLNDLEDSLDRRQMSSRTTTTSTGTGVSVFQPESNGTGDNLATVLNVNGLPARVSSVIDESVLEFSSNVAAAREQIADSNGAIAQNKVDESKICKLV